MSGWTPENVALLEKLWTEGYTSSQIASALGWATRNSVIAKIDRLRAAGKKHLARRSPSINQRWHTRSADKQKPPMAAKPAATRKNPAMRFVPPSVPFVPDRDDPVPVERRRSILDLEPHHCRWPIGDPRAPDFSFCPDTAVSGLSYCERHARRAVEAVQLRRNVPPSAAVPQAEQGLEQVEQQELEGSEC